MDELLSNRHGLFLLIDTLLIREFRLYLADLDIKRKDERRLETKQQRLQNSNNSSHYGFRLIYLNRIYGSKINYYKQQYQITGNIL